MQSNPSRAGSSRSYLCANHAFERLQVSADNIDMDRGVSEEGTFALRSPIESYTQRASLFGRFQVLRIIRERARSSRVGYLVKIAKHGPRRRHVAAPRASNLSMDALTMPFALSNGRVG